MTILTKELPTPIEVNVAKTKTKQTNNQNRYDQEKDFKIPSWERFFFVLRIDKIKTEIYLAGIL